MELIKPSYEIVTPTTPAEGDALLKQIEKVARVCYQSQDKITEDGLSAQKLVKFLRDKNHQAMIEFGDIIVSFTTDRGISHELVRHRLCSFAQESTRYVTYNNIQVLCPPEILTDPQPLFVWEEAIRVSEMAYASLLELGLKPQTARSVFPTCLKTQIVIKANIREWRHIFTMRTPITAHPDMRRLMNPLLTELKELIPIVFDDLEVFNC